MRNNWLNLKNLNKTFFYNTFLDFDSKQLKLTFNDLRIVYDYEKHLIIKKAYKLNYKSLYLNNFDRQEV